MTRVSVLFSTSLAVLALVPAVAWAQAPAAPATDRGYVLLDIGVQSRSQTVTVPGSFPLYGETATFDSQVKLKSGTFLNVGAGARVWRNMLIGVAYTNRFTTKSDSSVNVSAPHPLFFDSPRQASATIQNLENREYGVHVSLGWRVDVATRFDVTVFGGPSFFGVTQDVLTALDIEEVGPPYDEVSIGGTPNEASDSGAGFHVGLDGSYMFSRRVGVGILIRYSRGSVDLTTSDGGSVSIDAGGFEAGGGVRIRF